MIYNNEYHCNYLNALRRCRKARQEGNVLLRQIAIETALMWRRLSRFKA